MTTDHKEQPPITMGVHGHPVDGRSGAITTLDCTGDTVEFVGSYEPPPVSLGQGDYRRDWSPTSTCRDLARFAPPWWMVLLAVVVGLMLVAWVGVRAWQAIYEGGR